MRQRTKIVIPIGVAAMTLSACGSGSGGYGSSGSTATKGGAEKVSITSPVDGASVKLPFMLTWNSTVPLGAPNTGKDHVHVYLDGKTNDYTVVGGTQFQLKNLAPGMHKIEVALQRADHSPVGPKSAITVNVGGGAPSSPSPTHSGGRGY
jgi:hypothetical protein